MISDRMYATVAVAVGGALGAVVRYEVWLQRDSQRWLMLSTFSINVVGCLLLGAALGYLSGRAAPILRAGLIGVSCGFTTFGFYAVQGVTHPSAWNSVVYIFVTPVACVAALGIGALITRPREVAR